MTRGNQRELARVRNAKKQEQAKKSQNASSKTGVSTDKRMERDADIMRKKQEKAQEKKGESSQAQANKVVKVDPLK